MTTFKYYDTGLCHEIPYPKNRVVYLFQKTFNPYKIKYIGKVNPKVWKSTGIERIVNGDKAKILISEIEKLIP